MAGKPLVPLSSDFDDWAGQLLAGAEQDDVLVAAPDMAPFLQGVAPFIRVVYSRYVIPGAVYRMDEKQAELGLQGMQNSENE